MERKLQYLTQIHMRFSLEVAIPILEVYSEATPKTIWTWKYMYTKLFTTAMFIIAKYYKQPKISIHTRLSVWWYIHSIEQYGVVKQMRRIFMLATEWFSEYFSEWKKQRAKEYFCNVYYTYLLCKKEYIQCMLCYLL